jgi:hypothetical protein
MATYIPKKFELVVHTFIWRRLSAVQEHLRLVQLEIENKAATVVRVSDLMTAANTSLKDPIVRDRDFRKLRQRTKATPDTNSAFTVFDVINEGSGIEDATQIAQNQQAGDTVQRLDSPTQPSDTPVVKFDPSPSRIVKLRIRHQFLSRDGDNNDVIVLKRVLSTEPERPAQSLVDHQEQTLYTSPPQSSSLAMVDKVYHCCNNAVEHRDAIPRNKRQSLASILAPDPPRLRDRDTVVPDVTLDSFPLSSKRTHANDMTSAKKIKLISALPLASVLTAVGPPCSTSSAIVPTVASLIPITDPTMIPSLPVNEAEANPRSPLSAGGVSSFQYRRGVIEREWRIDEHRQQLRKEERELETYKLDEAERLARA